MTGALCCSGKRNVAWEPLGRRPQVLLGHTESEASQGHPEMVLGASSSK